MRRIWWLGSCVLILGLPGRVHAQPARAVRFEITEVGDSTLAFRLRAERWVRPGLVGTAVDPRRRDQLVARFRVLQVRDSLATALVTGQTTSVSTDHVALLEERQPRFFRTRAFWSGVAVGSAIGLSAVLLR